MANPRPALHVPLLAAASMGIYAVTLSGVTYLQAQHDRAVAAQQQPLLDAAARAAVERSLTQTAIRRAADALQAASDRYATTAEASTQLDAALAALAAQVSETTGAAARLPTSVALPAAPARVVIQAAAAAPAVQATTGASGQ
jgi:hypothetical protein